MTLTPANRLTQRLLAVEQFLALGFTDEVAVALARAGFVVSFVTVEELVGL